MLDLALDGHVDYSMELSLIFTRLIFSATAFQVARPITRPSASRATSM